MCQLIGRARARMQACALPRRSPPRPCRRAPAAGSPAEEPRELRTHVDELYAVKQELQASLAQLRALKRELEAG
jgi:hypothetical protein